MKKKKLGQLDVSSLGLGCMGMSEFYGPSQEEMSIQTIHKAYEMGITFFDTADMYGFGQNEELVGRAVRPFRDKIILATKFGIIRKKEDPPFRGICGRPDYVRRQCELSLKRLGVETIDLYYQHRMDPETPIEETMYALSQLVQEGKIRAIGLSEASPESIKRAHAVHPITALQSEYSLWTRDPEIRLLSLCKELQIGFVAYSPMGRGFLSGKMRSVDELDHDDFRRQLPRFQKGNISHNFQIVAFLEKMAREKGCTTSQLALAWVMSQGGDCVVPLFGTTKVEHLMENKGCLQVLLTEEEKQRIEDSVPLGFARGDRYPEKTMRLYQFFNQERSIPLYEP